MANRAPLPIAVTLLATAAARGAEMMPFVSPQSDTTVVYVTGPGVRQTFRASPSLGLQRVDAPGGGMAMITDVVHHTVTILDLHAHVFSVGPGPAGTADLRGRRATTGYVRVGQAVVAGLACTAWATHDPSGHPVTVCLTDDGVMTRARAGNDVLVEAVSVEHEAEDPALFAPPPGWKQVRR